MNTKTSWPAVGVDNPTVGLHLRRNPDRVVS
jgi:hypothetical protein